MMFTTHRPQFFATIIWLMVSRTLSSRIANIDCNQNGLVCTEKTSRMLKNQYLERHQEPVLHKVGAFFHVQHSSQIKAAFLKYKIIPEIVAKAPKNVLRVQFGRGRDSAKFGNVLNPRELQHRPKLIYWPAEDDEAFSLFVLDADRDGQKNSSWLYWYVVNIHGSKVRTGFEVAEYVYPNPSKGTGLHRVIYLVYKQPLGHLFFYDEMYLNDTRSQFKLEKIIKKYNFDDRPVAGNFFQTQWYKPRSTRKPSGMISTTSE